jgi:diacylglycerol kinase (ATP)
MSKVAFIYNSNAGKSSAPLLPLLGTPTDWLETARAHLRVWLGNDVPEYATTTHDETIAATKDAIQKGAELIIAAGGDGTVGAVADILTGTSVTLGILPRGTVNVLSRELRIPLDSIEEALDICLTGDTVAMDVGQVGTMRFLLNCSVGFDALAVQNVNPDLKGIVGSSAYVVSSLANAAVYTPPRFVLTLDEDPPFYVDAFTIIIANTGAYGGDLRIAPDARINDGQFDLCIFEAPEGLPAVQWAAFLRGIGAWAIGRHTTDPNVHFYRARRIQIETNPPTAVQIDGDAIGNTPVTVEILPRSLRVRVPRNTRE